MEGHKNTQIRVGLFLALGLLGAVVSILALGGDKSLFKSYVRLNAKLEQVQGLSMGSIVSLSGVTVGNIEEIKFSTEHNSLIVVMKIEKSFGERIARNSTVEIRTQGALGDKFIYITPGDASGGLAQSGDTLEAGKSSDLMGIIAEKGGEAGKIFDIISETHKLLKSVNAENRTEKILKNLADASVSFKALSEDSRQLLAEIRSQNNGHLKVSMQRLESVLTKIDKGQGTLGALINDPTLHEQLKTMLGGTARKQYFQSVLQNSIQKKSDH